MSDPGESLNSRGRRHVTTVLDLLRARIEVDRFDAAIFSVDTVVADLGYGDVRALPGSVAWIDKLRAAGKRTAVVAHSHTAPLALELAGIDDRFDAVKTGPSFTDLLMHALDDLGVAPEHAIAVGSDPHDLRVARELGVALAIGVVRGAVAPEELRKAGVATVVADLDELVRLT